MLLKTVAQMRDPVEVIVVDGGSDDGTVAIACAHGVRVLTAARGRGTQLHAGACRARGEALWFLHADTLPPPDAAAHISAALRDPAIIGGNFTPQFDGTRRAARFLTWLYPHLQLLGLCYGDSAMFVRRRVYEQSGGFRPFPIFEDLDLLRRLRSHGRFHHVPVPVLTSSRRFEGRNFALTFVRWTALQLLYWLGVPPRLLAMFYAPIRGEPGK